MPIPAKFQTSLGSLETDGVVIDPPPTGSSDLSIAKTHIPSQAIPGETVTYTVTVSNVGTSASSGAVTVTETPPPGLTVTALSGTGWTCTVPTSCTRSDALAPGASYPPITVTTSVGTSAPPGTVTNTAVVSGGGDSSSTNNTATDPTVIAAPAPGMDLTITKTHSPSTVVPGQTFTYLVTVLNVGTSPSSGTVTVTETPPAGVTVTALSGAGWTCTVATLTCTRSDALAPATSYPEISVTASVGANVAPGTVTNTAVVSGGGDPNPGNNTATDPTVITSAPASGGDLTISKTHSPNIAIPGGTVTYAVTVTNVASSPSSGAVTVTETPPTGMTITALSGTGWTCTIPTCTRSDALAPGTSYPPIIVTTSVSASAPPGTVTNTAVVSGGGDSNSTNNTATDPTIIAAPAPGMDLTITKSHSQNTVVPGQAFTYFSYRVERGRLAVERPGDCDRDAAGGGDGYGALRHRMDLHSRNTDLHSKRHARRGDELSGDFGDGECRRQCGAWHGDEHRSRIRAAATRTPATTRRRIQQSSPLRQQDPTSRLRRRSPGAIVIRGQLITFTLRVTNVGTGPTSGTITVTEAPPPGLTITALSGAGWTCIVATRTCLRDDALAPGASYPDITVTARIAPDATGTLGNRAVVSGGGDADPGNSIGLSPITLPPLPVPALPLSFGIGLMSALLATALWALRARTT